MLVRGRAELISTWKPADFFHEAGPGVVACELCPHRCVLADGEAGLCKVRRCRDHKLETLVIGSAVQHWTPIERKPLYHFRPGTEVMTLAGPGCTFSCGYCQNYRLSQWARMELDDVVLEPFDAQRLVEAASARGGAIGFSYSEPTLAAELTLELDRYARPLNVPIVWKTNGFVTPAALARLLPCLTALNVDIKAIDDRRHVALTGASLDPILETIGMAHEAGVWVEVSTPLIPRISTSPAALGGIAGAIAKISTEIPWHLVRFNPEFRMASYAPTDPADILVAKAIGHEAGLTYVYNERALGPAGRRTLCPECKATVVERGIWSVEEVNVSKGACTSCGHQIPGDWGRQLGGASPQAGRYMPSRGNSDMSA